MNEQELISRITLGDESALELLHQAYYQRLVRFLYRLTADKEHIVEIVNDVFFTVWKSAINFRGDSTLSTWILGIAYKKGLQSVSRTKAMTPLTDEDLGWRDESEELLEERNNAQLFRQLSPAHRAVMELTYYFGYSYKEIAVIVDCPENTVKTRMFHGRQRLRTLLRADTKIHSAVTESFLKESLSPVNIIEDKHYA